jgi:hypothetical protein
LCSLDSPLTSCRHNPGDSYLSSDRRRLLISEFDVPSERYTGRRPGVPDDNEFIQIRLPVQLRVTGYR